MEGVLLLLQWLSLHRTVRKHVGAISVLTTLGGTRSPSGPVPRWERGVWYDVDLGV